MADALAEAAKQIAALQKQVRKLQARNTPSVYMGWTNIPVQPTYVSATSILFTGIDLTAHLKSYIKCRWYQSGWKYGYVSSSSLGSGNTTATLVTNTSYTVANAAITNFSISHGSPVDFPATFLYTPTVSTTMGFTAPSFVLNKFYISGGICEIWIRFSTTLSGVASNEVKFTNPVPAVMGTSAHSSGSAMINFLLANGYGSDSTYFTIKPISGNYSLGATNLFAHASFPVA